MSLLSILIFLPLAGGALILLLPRPARQAYRYIALCVSLLQLALSGYLYAAFNPALAGVSDSRLYQFAEQLPWIRLDLGSLGRLEIDYYVGVDGVSLPFFFLTALVMTIAVVASWGM